MKKFLWVVCVVFLLAAITTVAGADPKTKALIINPKSDLEVRLWTDKGSNNLVYRVGEKVQFYFEVNENAFVTILDITPDGKVKQVFPNEHQSNNFAWKNRMYRVPDNYDIFAAPPTGEETVVAIATRHKPFEYPHTWTERGWSNLRSKLRKRLDAYDDDWAIDVLTIRVIPRYPQEVEIRVDSYLDDVKLYVDGQYAGRLPERVELEEGEHQLVAMKKGYKIAVRNIYVDEYTKDSRWFVHLEPLEKKPDKSPFEVDVDFNFNIEL